MGDDRDERLMSSREAAWPVVKQSDVAQSGCLRQQKVCHRRATLMHQANVASVSPCCIHALPVSTYCYCLHTSCPKKP